MFKNIDWKDLLERAVWTFLQGALAVWLLSEEPLSTQALVGAVAAGLSALKTFVVTWMHSRK